MIKLFKKRKKKNKIWKLLFIILIFCTLGALVLYRNLYIKNNYISKQALVNYIPEFENLSLNDLPNFTDFRSVYDYNGKIILVGFNKIVEYDKSNNKYTRINDPQTLNCIYSTAKINNFLFVSCNSHFPEGNYLQEAKTIISSKIYKIDLLTGKIVKEYFGQEIPNDGSNFNTKGARSNLSLGARGNILYMASWDGVEKMDIQTEKITLYSGPNEIKGGDELLGMNLYLIDDPGVSRLSVPRPTFECISPISAGTYYLFANDGVYTLIKGGFPQKIINTKIELDTNCKSIISKNGKYLIALNTSRHVKSEYIQPLWGINAYLIDLENYTVKDLSIQSIDTSSTIEKNSDKILNGYLEEDNGIIYLKNNENNNNILSVALPNGELNLQIK